MKNFRLFKVVFMLSFMSFAYSENEDFQVDGIWCGQWDGLYTTCFTIERKDEGYQALYEWEEQIGRGAQKKQLKGVRMNDNTVNFENKIIVFNLKNPDLATAIGIFKQHSRTALLTRKK